MAVIPKSQGKRVYRNADEVKSGKWDVIIIGSGIGGMSCASALSQLGKKVLVLEQHYLPGGFTHMFGRKGYQWDVGVHAIGEMTMKDVPGRILHWLSGGKVEMLPLGNPYDRFWFPEGYKFNLPDNPKAYESSLVESFPDQTSEIKKYLKLVKRVGKTYSAFFFLFKTFPVWLEKLSNRLVHVFFKNWWKLTTEEVLDLCNIKGKLRTILTVHWGYYGSTPNESSFVIHALTHVHFWNGAYYPKGGAKSFAEGMLSKVLEHDGDMLVRAKVKSVLIDKNKAYGVELEDGQQFFAKHIISAAGAKTSVKHLVPDSGYTSSWRNKIAQLENSPSYLCLNLGFKGDIQKAGAKASNLWLFHTWERNKQLWDFTDPKDDLHILYVSFPSLKDPEHDPGKEIKHTGECVTFVDYAVFKRFADSDWGKRPEGYAELKELIISRIMKRLKEDIPEIMEFVDFVELSTPITAEHFCSADKGAIYGLAANPERFTCSELRTRTPVKNLYMTGIDIASLGVTGGMVSGVLTAATLDKRAYLKLI